MTKPTSSHRYGEHRSQVCDVYLPEGHRAHPVCVLVHGGFWQSMYDRSLMAPLASDLVARGYAVWNIEYRRIGEAGGGWPGTFEDVAAAVDLLAAAQQILDLDRVAGIGHSAGAHLALWLAGRPKLPEGAPGAHPRVVLRAAVAQAGVFDLRLTARSGMGGGPTIELMGAGPDEMPERYALASPIELLPLGIPQLLVHGGSDRIVPVQSSMHYARAAGAAGDPVELVAPDRAGHMDVINPRHPTWKAVVDRLPRLLGLTERDGGGRIDPG